MPVPPSRGNRWSPWSASGVDTSPFGATAWKLINFLSLSHLGLIDRDAKDRAGALREMLALFTDLSETVSEQRIRGHRGRLQPADRAAAAPEERLQRGARHRDHRHASTRRRSRASGIFLLGAILDRFFAEYTSLNSFTETVIESKQRGLVKRWPPRAGAGQVL